MCGDKKKGMAWHHSYFTASQNKKKSAHTEYLLISLLVNLQAVEGFLLYDADYTRAD